MNTRSSGAVIFDLDGVITDTARVHAEAWRATFDAFLAERAVVHHETFRPFDTHADYLGYIDGKPRYEGVRSFLQSRGICLPHGNEDDGGERHTVCGVGNRKDGRFLALLSTGGVPVFGSSIRFIEQLLAQHRRCAVASSSRNCRRVLRAARLEHLFETTVDGTDAAALGLHGKPHPDLFLRSAETLRCEPATCVVVEDSIPGVAAGRRGGFGLVIGVDRTGIRRQLSEHGAHWVVEDLAELSADSIAERFDGVAS